MSLVGVGFLFFAAEVYGGVLLLLLGVATAGIAYRLLSKPSYHPEEDASFHARLAERLSPEVRQAWYRACYSYGLMPLAGPDDPRVIGFGGEFNGYQVQSKTTSRKTTCVIINIEETPIDADWAIICCPLMWDKMLNFGENSLFYIQKTEDGSLAPRDAHDELWSVGTSDSFEREEYREVFPQDPVFPGGPLAEAGIFVDDERLCIECLDMLVHERDIKAFLGASIGLIRAMQARRSLVLRYAMEQLQKNADAENIEVAIRFARMLFKLFASDGQVWVFFLQTLSAVQAQTREVTARQRPLFLVLLSLFHEHYGGRNKAKKLLLSLCEHPDDALRSMALLLQGWERCGTMLRALFREYLPFSREPVAFSALHWELLETMVTQEQADHVLEEQAIMLADWCKAAPHEVDLIYPLCRAVELTYVLAERLACETTGFRKIEEAWIELLHFQAKDLSLLAAQAMGIKLLSAPTPRMVHLIVLDAFIAYGTTRALKPLEKYIGQWTLSAAVQDKVKQAIAAIYKRFPASQGGMLSVAEGDPDTAQGALSYVQETDGKVSLIDADEGDEGGAS